jgi:hypothetical protein
MQLELEHQAS